MVEHMNFIVPELRPCANAGYCFVNNADRLIFFQCSAYTGESHQYVIGNHISPIPGIVHSLRHNVSPNIATNDCNGLPLQYAGNFVVNPLILS